ncbi:adenosylmethionine decarboxylase [Parasulfitobacter algicola]|uniref:S-adenosylmethionine decarboxylase proenzyme n=1 Tax=Parasulfitobacter algicola TaxID=2614809 RepID=A0ABX2ITF2_9RHOB|nr:adenosylmethionine decarboxylase [Sulfitobacter algicola]NSX56189.1 adenosylmethionine decarboxylase [Sulfitobacter algicola]
MTVLSPFDIDRKPDISLGKHLIVEFQGAISLEDPNPVAQAIKVAAEKAGATVLDVKMHNFGEGQGVTGVALLAESHISIHTWPEHGYAAIDVFMCGDADTSLSIDHLRAFFKPQSESVVVLNRGCSIAHRPAPE